MKVEISKSGVPSVNGVRLKKLGESSRSVWDFGDLVLKTEYSGFQCFQEWITFQNIKIADLKHFAKVFNFGHCGSWDYIFQEKVTPNLEGVNLEKASQICKYVQTKYGIDDLHVHKTLPWNVGNLKGEFKIYDFGIVS